MELIPIKDAMNKIHAPKGVTSIIAGVMSNDFTVFPHSDGVDSSLENAKEQVKNYKKSLDECQSDWSYWSILGDLEYWRATVNILKAAKLCNGMIPDVYCEMGGGVVMDEISKVAHYGEAVFKEAKKFSKIKKPSQEGL